MVDANWVPLSDAAQRTGMSRQGVHRAASGPLGQLQLSRQDAKSNWEISEAAIEYYVEHRQWPKAIPTSRATSGKTRTAASAPPTSDPGLSQTIDELRARVESAEMGAALEVAAANTAQLAERDARIDALQEAVANLEAELEIVRAEYSSMLLARAASMTDRPR